MLRYQVRNQILSVVDQIHRRLFLSVSLEIVVIVAVAVVEVICFRQILESKHII